MKNSKITENRCLIWAYQNWQKPLRGGFLLDPLNVSLSLSPAFVRKKSVSLLPPFSITPFTAPLCQLVLSNFTTCCCCCRHCCGYVHCHFSRLVQYATLRYRQSRVALCPYSLHLVPLHWSHWNIQHLQTRHARFKSVFANICILILQKTRASKVAKDRMCMRNRV